MKNYAGRTAGRAAGQITAGRGGAVRAAGQVTAGRGGLRAMMWQTLRVRADCGPSYCGAGCGLRFPARAGP